MLASIQKVEGGYIARFDRPLKHSVEKVWAALTENDKLARWIFQKANGKSGMKSTK